MRKKLIIIVSFISIFLLMGSLQIQAESNFLNRINLIKASQQLQEEQVSEVKTNKLGVFVTNYGSLDGEVNPGFRMDIKLPVVPKGSMVIEGIYLKAERSAASFISLKFAPFNSENFTPYIGLGVEITGQANYQSFVGIEFVENLYLEAKYINERGDFNDSQLFMAAGYQLKF